MSLSKWEKKLFTYTNKTKHKLSALFNEETTTWTLVGLTNSLRKWIYWFRLPTITEKSLEWNFSEFLAVNGDRSLSGTYQPRGSTLTMIPTMITHQIKKSTLSAYQTKTAADPYHTKPILPWQPILHSKLSVALQASQNAPFAHLFQSFPTFPFDQ